MTTNWDARTVLTSIAGDDTEPIRDTSETTVGGKVKLITHSDRVANESGPAGFLRNGKIVVTLSGNNLVVSIKDLAGSDPSATSPVYVRIGDTERKITAALSVTVTAGTNTFNAGSAELATKEIDYFVYLAYKSTATAGVVIGISRIPWGSVYSDFSGTATSETYAAFSTAPASTDDCVVIGRIAATLSAGAGYTWTSTSQSAPTTVNTVQRPVYETRWLTWVPTWSASGSLTYTSVSTAHAHYRLSVHKIDVKVRASGTLGGTASNVIFCTSPFAATLVADTPAIGSGFTAGVYGGMYITAATGLYSFIKYDNSNYATSGSNVVNMIGAYEI